MEPLVLRNKRKPEDIIRDAIVKKLRLHGWFVKVTHGNTFQTGFPDLYLTHKEHGPRWVDVKQAGKYCFTPAQVRDWPQFMANGSPIWILVSDEDAELHKLFSPANLYAYMVPYSITGK